MSTPKPDPLADPQYRGARAAMTPALMRQSHTAAMERLYESLRAAGFDDVRVSHNPIFQFPGPHGSSPGDIAARTGRSKQHVNILLNELQAAGYLERRPDPADNRGRVVWLTERGMDLVAATQEALEAIEADWTRTLGRRRFAELKRALSDLSDAERAAGTDGGSTPAAPGR